MNSEQIVVVALTPRAMEFFDQILEIGAGGIVRRDEREFVMPDVQTAVVLMEIIIQNEGLGDEIGMYKEDLRTGAVNLTLDADLRAAFEAAIATPFNVN